MFLFIGEAPLVRTGDSRPARRGIHAGPFRDLCTRPEATATDAPIIQRTDV
jgi:hypothetical protein